MYIYIYTRIPLHPYFMAVAFIIILKNNEILFYPLQDDYISAPQNYNVPHRKIYRLLTTWAVAAKPLLLDDCLRLYYPIYWGLSKSIMIIPCEPGSIKVSADFSFNHRYWLSGIYQPYINHISSIYHPYPHMLSLSPTTQSYQRMGHLYVRECFTCGVLGGNRCGKGRESIWKYGKRWNNVSLHGKYGNILLKYASMWEIF